MESRGLRAQGSKVDIAIARISARNKCVIEGSHGIAALPPCAQKQLKSCTASADSPLIARPFRRPLAVTAVSRRNRRISFTTQIRLKVRERPGNLGCAVSRKRLVVQDWRLPAAEVQRPPHGAPPSRPLDSSCGTCVRVSREHF